MTPWLEQMELVVDENNDPLVDDLDILDEELVHSHLDLDILDILVIPTTSTPIRRSIFFHVLLCYSLVSNDPSCCKFSTVQKMLWLAVVARLFMFSTPL
jgi:hypothetical protein